MSLILRSAAVSDLGMARENNEDAAYAGTRLVAVADGIGGLPGGEVASDIVIRALTDLDRESGGSALDGLYKSIDAANRAIRAAVDSAPDLSGMGTTLTAILLDGERIALAHVGDSRAYLLRDRVLTQLTKDDTYVQALVDRGALTASEARVHPQRSLITQAVQGQQFNLATAVVEARAGDRLLLCSDGLSDMVEDADIAAVLRDCAEPRECGQRLIELALAAGGRDNITTVVADVARTAA